MVAWKTVPNVALCKRSDTENREDYPLHIYFRFLIFVFFFFLFFLIFLDFYLPCFMMTWAIFHFFDTFFVFFMFTICGIPDIERRK